MTILTDTVVDTSVGKAFEVRKGQMMRITPFLGPQHADFVAFNLNNLDERFSQARTKVNQGKIRIALGDKLYSRDNNVMFTIIEDKYGEAVGPKVIPHDLQYGMCSRWVYRNIPHVKQFASDRKLAGKPPEWGCYENLIKALEPWGIKPHDIPDPFNIFQTVQIDEFGRLNIIVDTTKPDQYIDLKAEMDCLVGISACPSCGKALKVQIFS